MRKRESKAREGPKQGEGLEELLADARHRTGRESPRDFVNRRMRELAQKDEQPKR